MPAKVASARLHDNQVAISTSPPLPTVFHTGDDQPRCYAVRFVQRLGGFTPSTAALYAALAGLIVENA